MCTAVIRQTQGSVHANQVRPVYRDFQIFIIPATVPLLAVPPPPCALTLTCVIGETIAYFLSLL